MSVDQKWLRELVDRSTIGGDNESEELSVKIAYLEEEQFNSLEIASEEVAKAGQADDHHAMPKIQQVPFMLRDNENFVKYFKPKLVSVGPYHHKDPNLKITNPIKLKLAANFIKETGVNKKTLYFDIKNQIKKFRDCYDNEATKDYLDHELAWIFLVDGCAILQFMYISADDHPKNSEKYLRKLGIKTDHVAFGQHDLFLMDNQLPYQLLQLIMRSTSKEEDMFLQSIDKFIFDYTKAPGQKYQKNDEILKDNHVHLLDLMRKILIQPRKNNKPTGCGEIIINLTVDLFDKLKSNDKISEHWHSFRNMKELRSAGIKLKPSETSGVRDITFSGGTLKLPPIVVDESTAAKFLNMAAYEMCPDFQNDFEVSSYLCLMDVLIVDRAHEVKELRENNILHNALGSDKEVATLFNEISTDLVPSEEIYLELKSHIEDYFNTIWLKWLRQVFQDLRDYFKGRWSLLAFIGAFLALASSIIQTVYTVLGYHAG
ncbi:hypothetical protein EZV62_027196 [Acer yangbiense]|uniref:Uncharacterized protein n=1 Tax=Acer yangbiense TaxID=1000413 RepID=A0A5C7GU87_9ROSI|nr:hypothetical protein EZV62_027196 [Acer yangbiense]